MLRQIGFRLKLTLIVSGAMTLGVVTYLVIFSIQNQHALQKSLELRARLGAAMEAEALSVPLWDLNVEVTQSILDSLNADPDFIGAVVRNEQGEVFAQYGEVQRSSNIESASQPITFTVGTVPKTIGSVSVFFSNDAIKQNATRHFIYGLFSFLGLVVLVSAVVLRGLWSLTRPILQISEGMKKIAAGARDVPLPEVTGTDEIADLSSSLTWMLRELKTLNQGLEEKVEQRTNQLALAVEEAENSNRIKSLFLATMSHELRTPLNGIIGMHDVLLGTQLKRDQQRYIAMAKESAETMVAIINDVLDISKIEAGRLALEALPTNLEQVVAQVFRSIGIRAAMKGLALVCEITPSSIPHALVDPLRIRQILLNLVGNAIKFTESGGVTVKISPALSQESARGRLQISVTDTGIGLSPTERMRLFQPYQQASSTTARIFGGTGLGLSICRQLVELMEGEIYVESETGKGSTFYITIPVTWIDTTPEVRHSETVGAVLVIDQSHLFRTSIYQTLSGRGIQNFCAESISEALPHLEKAPRNTDGTTEYYAVLINSRIFDSAIPSEIEMLKRQSGNRIVVTVALNELPETERLLAAGAKEVLPQPFVPSEMVECFEGLTKGGVPQLPLNSLTQARSAAEQSVTTSRHLRVLVSDDTQVNQLVMRLLLEQWGHSVHVTSNGAETLRVLQSTYHEGPPANSEFDLLLLDMNLPDISGFDVAAHIRSKEGEFCHLPIVALTAHASQNYRTRCLSSGMDDFLRKPLDRAALIKVIQAVADRRALPVTEERASTSGSTSDDAFGTHQATGSCEIIIDETELMERYGRDRAVIAEIMGAFCDESCELLSRLDAARVKLDRERIVKASHAIKGSAGNVSAKKLWVLADTLEQRAKDPDEKKLQLLCAEVVGGYAEVISLAAEQYLNQGTSSVHTYR